MSTTNGSVAVSVQVPVLGTITGVRTLKDIMAGIPGKPPVEGPPVAVKDPDARILAALTGAAAGPAAAAPAATPVAPKPDEPAASAAAAKPAPAPVAGATAAADPEAEANKLLKFADSFLQANMKAKAIVKYEELVKKYPQTAAGKTAKAKLATLGE